jgi:HlyD family secretion protein
MKLNKRIFIVIGIVAIAAMVILAVAIPRLTTSEVSVKNTEKAVVRRGTLTATVNATGAISPIREAQLAFNITGALVKLDVKQGDNVKSGQALASLDARELELQLAQSEASLASAQSRLDQLKNPSPSDVSAAQAAVASAEAALAQLKTPNQNDYAIAKADIDKAAAAVSRAQADYDRIGGASNPFIASLSQSLNLQQASIDYQKALAAFNARVNPSDSQIKSAQAALEQARSQLAKLVSPSANDVKNVQASVDQARASRDLSKTRLDYAVIKAPFDGLVTHVDVDLGTTVTVGRAIIGVADVSEYRVKLNIDETDIAQIRLGEDTSITLDAYPELPVNAKVTEVATTATTVQGIVNYVVAVTLMPSQAPVKIGMTADANIVIMNRENVLLISNRAVRASGNHYYATIDKGSQVTEEIEIKIGMANDQETEVVSGLSESQVVIIPLLQQLPGGGFGAPRR